MCLSDFMKSHFISDWTHCQISLVAEGNTYVSSKGLARCCNDSKKWQINQNSSTVYYMDIVIDLSLFQSVTTDQTLIFCTKLTYKISK
jgi:hypothetical protein